MKVEIHKLVENRVNPIVRNQNDKHNKDNGQIALVVRLKEKLHDEKTFDMNIKGSINMKIPRNEKEVKSSDMSKVFSVISEKEKRLPLS